MCVYVYVHKHYFILSPFPSHIYFSSPKQYYSRDKFGGSASKVHFVPCYFFLSLLSGLWNAGQAPPLLCGEGPLWCPDRTQWGTIEHARPPPRHTLCAPLALLERFSYANEKLPTSDTSLPTILPLFFPSFKTAPDLSLCPQLF